MPPGSQTRLRLALAECYGGGPAYWLDPDLDERVVATAIAMAMERKTR